MTKHVKELIKERKRKGGKGRTKEMHKKGRGSVLIKHHSCDE
jgi:hypothetical protein